MAIQPRSLRSTTPLTATETAIQPRASMTTRQSTAPEMATQPRAIETATKPAAPEMVIQPRAPRALLPQRTVGMPPPQKKTCNTTSNYPLVGRPAHDERDAPRRGRRINPTSCARQGSHRGRSHAPVIRIPCVSTKLQRYEIAPQHTSTTSVVRFFSRRARRPLPAFVELVHGQTEHDYRPNKHVIPAVLDKLCTGYKHLDKVQAISAEGVRVELKGAVLPQT